MRKVRLIQKESREAIEALKELEARREQAEAEEKELIESVTEQIKETCDERGLFCGVVLTPKDLGAIVELMATQKESVKIEFKLYFKEE
jgi:sialic acid synthase SpsE